MALRTILLDTEPTLRKKSRVVTQINERICTLLDDMIETLKSENGVGLAAPQVGVLRRVVVIDAKDEIMELINPEIISVEGELERIEGCLSSPGRYGVTVRPEKVTIKALDRNGVEYTYEADGLIAQAFCHEIDHLNGILFLDKVTRMLTEEEVEELKKVKSDDKDEFEDEEISGDER